MIIIHLSRSQRRILRERHPGVNNVYITRALRFYINSPLACRIRHEAMELGGKLLTHLNVKNI